MHTQTDDVIFARSMFGGFNRKDVIDYIETLQQKIAQGADDELRGQIDALRAERDALAAEAKSLREQITQLRAQLRVEQTANALLDEQRRGEPEESFSAEAESVASDDPKELSMRDVDDMVKKYFG
ncbi:MAG: hypothetical protein IJT41_00195 [Clostridia bacterium]|nr:hypothetical protein [Clostridia bacterium]